MFVQRTVNHIGFTANLKSQKQTRARLWFLNENFVKTILTAKTVEFRVSIIIFLFENPG